MKFMKKLRERCHWLKTMSAKVCALCTICEPPCERHDVGEKVPCQRHDCAHYIPLKSKVICCGPGRPLPLDSLHSWIEVSANGSVYYFLGANNVIVVCFALFIVLLQLYSLVKFSLV